MADTTFSDAAGTRVVASWLNNVNNRIYKDVHYLKSDTYGAVGDGVTDDTAAVQAAVLAGGCIDGGGGTFKCTAAITGFVSKTIIRNATFDFSSFTTSSGKAFQVYGSSGSTVALTANLAADAVIVSVGDTSTFTAEKWAFLSSTDVWGTIDGTTYGQYVKVKSVDSPTQLTLYAGPIVAFNTASSATIKPINMIERVVFQNCALIGSQSNSQVGIYYLYAQDCMDIGCIITDFDYAAVAMATSVNCKGNATIKRDRAVGLAYGYMIINGSYGCSVINGYGEDMRHYVTVGGTGGINLFWAANFNIVHAPRAAGIDSHNASYGGEAIGNQIYLAYGYGDEGITMQGINWKVNDNFIYNLTGVGILSQPLVTNGTRNVCIMRGNHVHFQANISSGSPIGIYAQVEPTNGGNYAAVTIESNQFYGGNGSTSLRHVYVNAYKASSILNDVFVRGNVSVNAAVNEALFVRTLGAGASIDNVIVDANLFSTTGQYPVNILSDGAGSTISELCILGNIIKGGSVSNINLDGSSGSIATIIESDNLYSGSVSKLAVAGTITGIKMRGIDDSNPITTTTATANITTDSNSYIANRAGTITYTFPSASTYPGRRIRLRTITANTVVSASSNIVPITGGAAGTAILPATSGKWAHVESDGTNWNIVAQG